MTRKQLLKKHPLPWRYHYETDNLSYGLHTLADAKDRRIFPMYASTDEKDLIEGIAALVNTIDSNARRNR